MMRVALYARYSSDNQRETALEDQFRICREQAKREKGKIVSTDKGNRNCFFAPGQENRRHGQAPLGFCCRGLSLTHP